MDWGILKLEVRSKDPDTRKTVINMVQERWKFLEEKSALRLLPSQFHILKTWDGNTTELLGMQFASGLLSREVQSVHPTLSIEFQALSSEEFERAEQALWDSLQQE